MSASPRRDSSIGARFRVLESVGQGGMATVYRAVDEQGGGTVAVKVFDADHDRERFAREARVLAELKHPRIVQYIAHGPTDDGGAYLAMEWLEGEDLAARLARGGVTLREALHIIHDLADALAAAHARGIVHRDLKPANVFLRGGRIDGVTLLDFGVARRMFDTRAQQTRVGSLVGTPNYMAPEQASGDRVVGPQADVFALGCILHECLLGEPPFVADHLIGILAKILFAEIEPVNAQRPEVPAEVANLVAALLAKEPEQRLADGADVVRAVTSLGTPPELGPPVRGAPTRSVTMLPPSRPSATSLDQILVGVIVAHVGEPLPEDARERLGVEQLTDGTYVGAILPDASRVATDQAVHVARLALELRTHAPNARIALTMGRGVVQERLPIGEAIDRAVSLLPRDASIVVDDLSAGLLGRRFEVTEGSRLVGEHADPDAMRVLLGKPTSCVGREQELTTLEANLATCIDESTAATVLVTGAPGMGKTRVRHELIRRVRAKHPELEVIAGVADAAHAGSTYHLLANALRELRARRSAVQHVAAVDQRRISELLDELCGTPVAEPCELVARARQEPRRLAEEIGAAFLELLRAETAVHPVLLVLEDVHWADAASVRLVERAIRELHELPLLVVALARPQVDERQWAGYAMRLPLRPLNRRACERLVQEVLGAHTPADVVARVAAQSAGNALFLEELIRATAEGRRDLPDTVLAMLQSRIAGLPPELRRVLRMASVFGERFARDGVASLLAETSSVLDARLSELARLEIIEAHGEVWAFRHGLVCDAAYGLLAHEDRPAAHIAAAMFLETAGSDPVELADHYSRANAPQRAVPWYMRAGLEANAIGDLSAARSHFAAASDTLRELPDEPANRRARIDILLQQVQMGIMAEVSDLNLARMCLARELLESYEHEPADRRRDVMIDFLSARVLNYMGSLHESRELCERVIVAARALGDDKLVAAASQTIGNCVMMAGGIDDALPMLAQGAALVDRIPGDYDRLRFLGNYAMCMTMAGRYSEALELHARAVDQALSAKHSSGIAVAAMMRGFSERVVGDPAAVATLSLARDHAERSNERLLYYLLVAQLAWVEGLEGQRAEALAHSAEARMIADELGNAVCYEDLFLGSQAQIAVSIGDLDGAIAIASEAVPRLRRDQLALGLGLCEQAWGVALALRGDADAEAHLRAAHDVFATTGQRMAAARLQLEWALLVRNEHTIRAEELRTAALATYTAAGASHLVASLEMRTQAAHARGR